MMHFTQSPTQIRGSEFAVFSNLLVFLCKFKFPKRGISVVRKQQFYFLKVSKSKPQNIVLISYKKETTQSKTDPNNKTLVIFSVRNPPTPFEEHTQCVDPSPWHGMKPQTNVKMVNYRQLQNLKKGHITKTVKIRRMEMKPQTV